MTTTNTKAMVEQSLPITPKPAPTSAPKAATKAVAKPATKAVTQPVLTASVKKKAAPKTVSKPIAKKSLKIKKIKMVRDSFTMPKPEFAILDVLKQRAATLAVPIKKTELIRAGIKALAAMTESDFLLAIRAVPNLKTGRPAKA